MTKLSLITRLLRKYSVIAFTAGMLFRSSIGASAPIRIEAFDSSSVRSAVAMALSWQKYWYGDFYGSECLGNPASGSVLIYRFNPDKNAGIGYISGTNFMIAIKPSFDRLVASISMGNMLGPCDEGELYPRVTNLKNDSNSIKIEFGRSVKPYPSFGAMPSEMQLMKIRSQLTQLPAIRKLESSDMPVRFTLGSSLDPYVIVCSRECEQNWVVDFEIEDSSGIKLGNMYDGDLYAGDSASLRQLMSEHVAARIRSKGPGVHSLFP